jgi:hypothetical protein
LPSGETCTYQPLALLAWSWRVHIEFRAFVTLPRVAFRSLNMTEYRFTIGNERSGMISPLTAIRNSDRNIDQRNLHTL